MSCSYRLCRQFRNVSNCRLGNDKALVHLDRLGAGIALLKVQTVFVVVGARYVVARQRRHEQTVIPTGFDYDAVRGLSAEVLAKLKHTQPATLGQAARIGGVTPAAISLLLVHLKRHAA